MTLRARLLIGVAAVVVALTVAVAMVARSQHRFTQRQLDRQLAAVLPALPRLVRADLVAGAARPNLSTPLSQPSASPATAAGPLQAIVADLYVGYIGPDGVLVTVATPVDDPRVLPVPPADLTPGHYSTVATSAGLAPRLRVVTSQLRPGLTLIAGVSTERIDAAGRRLVMGVGLAGGAVVVVLGLVVWWVLQLGLRPIRVMTDTAEALAAGHTSSRAPRFAAGTEADRLGLAMNRLVDASQAAETRLRRFVADASHELRTPLTTLRGYTDLYRAGGLREPEQLEDALRRIGQEAARMNHLVEDLFLLAELDEGRPLQRDPLDIGRVVTDLASDLRAVAPDRTIEVQLHSAQKRPLLVVGDEHRLTQAVAAYTSNALRHTPAGTPLWLSVQPVGERAGEPVAWVRVAVTDRGPGIEPESAGHVFERFYRVGAGRSRAGGGSGLGLAMVAAIIAAHGGRFGVQSRPGEGSTFWFELPTGRDPE